MERLARLIPVRTYGRFRHLRPAQSQNPCRRTPLNLTSVDHAESTVPASSWGRVLPSLIHALIASPALTAAPAANAAPTVPAATTVPAAIIPSLLPAFARLPLRHIARRQAPQAQTIAAPRASTESAPDPVRVYRTPSRVIMVGNIEAVCNMIDRCIADERAGLGKGVFE